MGGRSRERGTPPRSRENNVICNSQKLFHCAKFGTMTDVIDEIGTKYSTVTLFIHLVSEAKHQEPGLQQQPLYLPTPNNRHTHERPSALPHASKEADKAKKSSGT